MQLATHDQHGFVYNLVFRLVFQRSLFVKGVEHQNTLTCLEIFRASNFEVVQIGCVGVVVCVCHWVGNLFWKGFDDTHSELTGSGQ